MPVEVGEELVGAYLVEVLGCNAVSYNVRTPGGRIEGLQEIDVVGYDFDGRKAYLCEVATNLLGYFRKSPSLSVERVRRKLAWQRTYARRHLKNFPTREYMFWSPRVSAQSVVQGLDGIRGLTVVVNEQYARKVAELRKEARTGARTTANSAFRVLQILEHLRHLPEGE